MYRLAPLIKLPQEIQDAVRQLGDRVDRELLLRWVPYVERSFATMNFDVTWEHFRQNLRPETLLSLEFCSDQLQRLSPEQVIDTEQLNRLLADVRELQDAVVNGDDLDHELRDFLLRHLRALEYALQDYQFRGAPALRDAMAQAFGELYFRPDLRARARKSTTARRAWAVFQIVSQLVTFTANVKQIVGPDQPSVLLLLDSGEPATTDTPAPGPPEIHDGEIVEIDGQRV